MTTAHSASPRQAWNAGMIVGPKAPLKAKHIWEIRTRLKIATKLRNLALFNLAHDSKLRGCDIVKLRSADVMAGGAMRLRSTVVQPKTGRPVPFELTDPTREALVDWLKVRRAVGCDWVLPSRLHAGENLTTRQYARLVDERVEMAGLDSTAFGTHSPATHEGCDGLQAHWQSARLPTAPRAHEARKHLTLPRHRARRCTGVVRTDGDLATGRRYQSEVGGRSFTHLLVRFGLAALERAPMQVPAVLSEAAKSRRSMSAQPSIAEQTRVASFSCPAPQSRHR